MNGEWVKIIKETKTLFGEKSWKKQESTSVKIDNANHCNPGHFIMLIMSNISYFDMDILKWGWKLKDPPLNIGENKIQNILEWKKLGKKNKMGLWDTEGWYQT